jgi:ADP-heptose:LPS heptosyltransferase
VTGGSLQTKILVALPNNLGDVIMATPVLEGLKKKHKDASIAFFV